MPARFESRRNPRARAPRRRPPRARARVRVPRGVAARGRRSHPDARPARAPESPRTHPGTRRGATEEVRVSSLFAPITPGQTGAPRGGDAAALRGAAQNLAAGGFCGRRRGGRAGAAGGTLSARGRARFRPQRSCVRPGPAPPLLLLLPPSPFSNGREAASARAPPAAAAASAGRRAGAAAQRTKIKKKSGRFFLWLDLTSIRMRGAAFSPAISPKQFRVKSLFSREL